MSCVYDDEMCKYYEGGRCEFPSMGSGYPYDAPCFTSNNESLIEGDRMGRELKPCPFCGGEAHIFQIQEKCKLQQRLWVVRCPVCGANQLPFSEKHYAVEAWNRRVTE